MSRFVGMGASLALVLAAAHPAEAERQHEVRRGQTLAAIAQRYHISVDTLLAANRLDRNSVIRPGDTLRVPERGVVFVRPGETLSSIARDRGITVKALARQNRIRENATLRVGQRLLLPGHEAADRAEAAAKQWGRPRRPGIATFVRMPKTRKVRIRLVTRSGRVARYATDELARLMRNRRDRRTRRPPDRLARVLAQISDHFGGRPIYIVSGYRPAGGYTRNTSRHTEGRAVDIRIPGVRNRILRDYCRTLGAVGCGFYPNSTFVHVDVRDKAGKWIDWSGPGERPHYRRPVDLDDEAGDEDEGSQPAEAHARAEVSESHAAHGDEARSARVEAGHDERRLGLTEPVDARP